MNENLMLPILIGEFRGKIQTVKNLTPRAAQFLAAPNKIKVAIGMRRTGKTYFLFQQILRLVADGSDLSTILYLNFEDDRLLPLDEHKLAALVDAFYALYPNNHNQQCYLFFDEIQNVKNWPIVIRRLHDTKNAEIFLSGSSAKLLSKEIATSLRGRSLAIEIWPYSFQEYMLAKKITLERSLYDQKTRDSLTEIFHFYLSDGGFPELIAYSPEVRQQTLQEYLDVLLYRDIIERHAVKNPTLIKYMILSMIHNVGKPFAINKFFNDLKSRGYSIGKDTLYEYVDYIEDAYLAFSVPLYEKSIRKTSNRPKKIYAIDPGLVRALTMNYDHDLGKLFENIVYLELRRLGYTLHYYMTSDGYEIDFLAQSPRGHKELLQVVWNIQDPQTLEREKRALESGMKELKIEGKILNLDTFLRKGVTIPIRGLG